MTTKYILSGQSIISAVIEASPALLSCSQKCGQNGRFFYCSVTKRQLDSMYKNVGAQLTAVGATVVRSTEADEIQSANISESLSNQIRPTDPSLPPKLFLLSKAIRLGYHVVLDKFETEPLSYFSLFETFFPDKCISLEEFAYIFK